MSTITLSPQALSIIEKYLHFQVGSAVCSIPYFNNKTLRSRAGLRALIGKGSIKDITDEVHAFMVKQHISPETISSESLKKLLVDMKIGIDCSAFTYYVLDAELAQTQRGSLKSRIHFIHSTGIIGNIRTMMRPIENCDVATFADDSNSSIVPISEVKPGNMITMLGGPDSMNRDHILVIHAVDIHENIPQKIYYSHTMAYPEDGVYGTGIKQGTISITDPAKDIIDQEWNENGKHGIDLPLFTRAQKSTTQLRRLK
ncbi:MAG: hypothetical protein WCG07_00045 [Candidatus Taylorbacteria bacterium]